MITKKVNWKEINFPWYNKPIKSTKPEKKKMVLAKKGDEVKLIHFWDSSMQDYTQHKDKDRRKSYLARSAGIKDKNWNLTKDNILSANRWSRKVLWIMLLLLTLYI